MAEERLIKYVNRGFDDFRSELIEYAKNYFPDTYNDFSPASPGMMFIEMASYVGDVLAFYQDTQLQETFLTYARDPKNLYSLAYMMGYKPKVTGTSQATLKVTQVIEATGVNYEPNWDQAAVIANNSVYTSTDKSKTKFFAEDRLDFTFSSSYDPTEVVIDSLDSGNNPATYKLTKTLKAFSGEVKTATFTATSAQQFQTYILSDSNIVGILDVTDSDSNEWYEVPFLGQDTIYSDTANTNSDSNKVPYLLSITKAPRRFVTRFLANGNLQLQFGAGTNSQDDSTYLPDPTNVGLGRDNGISRMDEAYDPKNFLYSKSYGLAPSNTTLTVRYLVGGGASSNVPANTITSAASSNTVTSAGGDNSRLTSAYLSYTNPTPAEGGRDGDTVEELRQNSLRAFAEQGRTVTLQDYTVRTMSLPPKFGSIAKVFATQDLLSNTAGPNDLVSSNPLAVNLYVLAYDYNKKLITAPKSLKENIRTYLSEHIMITDSVNIRDAFVVNVGVEYDVVLRPNFSGRDVLLACNQELKKFFAINKWSINQPINLGQISSLLDKVVGVQTVQRVEIVNKQGGDYSQYAYDIPGAIKNNIIYPSYDPSIFEVKFPDKDIKGRVTVL